VSGNMDLFMTLPYTYLVCRKTSKLMEWIHMEMEGKWTH